MTLVSSIMYGIETLFIRFVEPLLHDFSPLYFLQPFACVLDVELKDGVVVVECAMMDGRMIFFVDYLQEVDVFFGV